MTIRCTEPTENIFLRGKGEGWGPVMLAIFTSLDTRLRATRYEFAV